MIAALAAFIAVALIGLLGLHGPAPAAAPERVQNTRRVELPRLAVAVAILTGSFLAQLALITTAARIQRPFPAWFSALPLLPIDDRGPLFGHAPFWSAVAACTLLQTLALFAVYRVGRGRRFGRRARAVVVAGVAAMMLAAFLTPAITSFDMYAYAGSAHASNAYHPPARAFEGDFGLINQIYGVPIFPSPYGPVWLALAHAALAPFRGLGAQLHALRLLGAIGLVACVFALRALRFSAAEISLVALNPALIADFVLDGHNDVTAIALILWAIALGARAPGVAVALGVLAGGIKLPFLAIAALATAGDKRLRVRVAGALLAVAGGIALSALLGGRDYLLAIRATTRIYGAAIGDPVADGAHVALALAALAAVALAVASRRVWPTASWAFVALAAAFFGWYVAWGLPYAAYERRWLAVFALSLPPLTFLLSTFYAGSALLSLTLVAAIVGAPIAAYVALRRRRPARAR